MPDTDYGYDSSCESRFQSICFFFIKFVSLESMQVNNMTD